MIRKPGWVRVSGTAGLSVTISVVPGCNSSYTSIADILAGGGRGRRVVRHHRGGVLVVMIAVFAVVTAGLN